MHSERIRDDVPISHNGLDWNINEAPYKNGDHTCKRYVWR